MQNIYFTNLLLKLYCGTFLLWMPITSTAQQAASNSVEIPNVSGPIQISDNSYPQLAVSRTQTPIDLAAVGYVEEEYFVSGLANVYDWEPDGSLIVSSANAPYTTRILVRRPTNPSQFSGNVVVETVNNARRYDWAFIWALSYQHFLENGDAYVAVTHTPQGIDSLRIFDSARYNSLSLANPNPEQLCGPQNTTSDAEEGLRWDMISQIGALLKSDSGPLAGFNVQYLYASTHTRELTTYVNSVHQHSSLADGTHVYDGFVIKSEYAPAERISRCATIPANGDPRQIVRNSSVPVIRVTAQGDVLATFGVRREDSDDPVDKYRLWEVAGAPHMDKIYYDHMPITEDLTRVGQTPFIANWPMAYSCTPNIDLLDFPIMRYTVNAAFNAVDQWARAGIAPPRADRISVSNGGTTDAAFINDEYGNVIGGVRSVYLDVPEASYIVHSSGPAVCNNLGHSIVFPWSKLEELYGTSGNYNRQVNESLDSLEAQGWVTPANRLRIQNELMQ